MGLLTRDQILQAEDISTRDIEVPEWGGTVRIRGLTGAERDQFEESITHQRPGRQPIITWKNIRAKLVALCTIDAEGKRLFTEEDVTALGTKSAQGLDRVFSVARELSGLSEQDIEDLAKN